MIRSIRVYGGWAAVIALACCLVWKATSARRAAERAERQAAVARPSVFEASCEIAERYGRRRDAEQAADLGPEQALEARSARLRDWRLEMCDLYDSRGLPRPGWLERLCLREGER